MNKSPIVITVCMLFMLGCLGMFGGGSGDGLQPTQTGNSGSGGDGKLFAPDPIANDQFGLALDLYEGTAIVGTTDRNTAYVFNLQQGVSPAQTLQPANAPKANGFGRAVAIDQNLILIGAPLDDEKGGNAGAGYIFARQDSSWRETKKLIATDGERDHHLGGSTALSENVALIGSLQSTYVFRRNGSGWNQEQKLTPWESTLNDQFGFAVSIDQDLAVIGAPNDSANDLLGAGAVYVFRYDGSSWNHEVKISASDRSAMDFFGYSVSVNGDRILVGALKSDSQGIDSGAAYVFRREGGQWLEEGKILPLDGKPMDEFGVSVDLKGDLAVVGAHLSNEQGDQSGTTYRFHWDGSFWSQERQFSPPDLQAGDQFGTAVALSGDQVLVGAPRDDTYGSDTGVVYFFTDLEMNQVPTVAFDMNSISVLATLDKTEPLWIDLGEFQGFTFANLVRAYGMNDPDGTIMQICLQGTWQSQPDCQNADVQLLAPIAYVTPYVPPGSYTLTLSVVDNLGGTASDTMAVDVLAVPASNQPPVAAVTRTAYTLTQGEDLLIDPIGLTGDTDPKVINMSGSFDPDGAIWEFDGCVSGDDIDGFFTVSCSGSEFAPGTNLLLPASNLAVGSWSGYVFVKDIAGLESNRVDLSITVLPPNN